MPATKEKLEQHLYKQHGSYPGSLVAASLDQIKEWHRHQHKVHDKPSDAPTVDYGAVPSVTEQGHNPNMPTVATHQHLHGGLTEAAQ